MSAAKGQEVVTSSMVSTASNSNLAAASTRAVHFKSSKQSGVRTTIGPIRSILDDSFHYVPAAATDVADTWRRFGWRPTTKEVQKKRRHRIAIETNRWLSSHLGDADSDAWKMFERFLAQENENNACDISIRPENKLAVSLLNYCSTR